MEGLPFHSHPTVFFVVLFYFLARFAFVCFFASRSPLHKVKRGDTRTSEWSRNRRMGQWGGGGRHRKENKRRQMGARPLREMGR
jgi:hypothetical protein